mmetsp:Transcript_25579/g.55030  ORF Transcript_25579/g.55030 Transcript_25579/m.55030 type:complete len:98 (+) Transcript_25579:2877-3170(+)
MEISHPLVSFVCGSGLKQYMSGNAIGEPQHQIAAAKDSANGVRHSRVSAVIAKHESRGPHPSSQQSGQVEDMASLTNCGASPRKGMGMLYIVGYGIN